MKKSLLFLAVQFLGLADDYEGEALFYSHSPRYSESGFGGDPQSVRSAIAGLPPGNISANAAVSGLSSKVWCAKRHAICKDAPVNRRALMVTIRIIGSLV